MVSLGVSLLIATSYQRAWGPFPPVAPFGMKPLPKERTIVPMIFPVVGACRWHDDYGSHRKGFLHTGIDIQAAKMTPIVAPFSGTIGFKRESFWIYGDNGWATLGTHLNDDNPGRHDHHGSRDLMFAPDLVPGQHVRSGQFIGYVGESGDATGPHLHFELYAPGKGTTMSRIRNPRPSLHLATRIHAPVPLFVKGRPSKGTMRLEGCIRRLDPSHGLLTIALVSKQMPNGLTRSISAVHYVRLHLSRHALNAVGGFASLHDVPWTTPIGLFVPASPNLDDATVSKVVIPGAT